MISRKGYCSLPVILGAVVVMLGLASKPGSTTVSGEESLPLRPNTLPLHFPPHDFARNSMSGGPPKDGIPAIDEPRFVPAAEAEGFLADDDIVFGVDLNGVAKAYPQKILVWHEIVNDVFAHESVSVTYCPLTGTAIGFRRGATTFGVSGTLVNNNLIMYDRATDSRWPQILGTAITGSFQGKSLQNFRVIWTSWERWKQRHPDTTVLSLDTGYARNYNRDPYGSYRPPDGYYAKDRPPLFPTMHADRRHAPKEVVIGMRTVNGAIAFLKSALREKKMISASAGGETYLAVYDDGLDTAYIYKNPEGQRFSFRDGRYMSRGRAWSADRLPLETATAFDAMWFAWVAFYPRAPVYE